MNQKHDDFSRLHPALDQALREQIKAPKMDAAFRQQVFARINARHVRVALEAPPEAMRAQLRARLFLQWLNMLGVVVAGLLLLGTFGPQLGSLLAREEQVMPATALLHQDLGLAIAVALGAGALAYGLHRARLLDWMRTLVS